MRRAFPRRVPRLCDVVARSCDTRDFPDGNNTSQRRGWSAEQECARILQLLGLADPSRFCALPTLLVSSVFAFRLPRSRRSFRCWLHLVTSACHCDIKHMWCQCDMASSHFSDTRTSHLALSTERCLPRCFSSALNVRHNGACCAVCCPPTHIHSLTNLGSTTAPVEQNPRNGYCTHNKDGPFSLGDNAAREAGNHGQVRADGILGSLVTAQGTSGGSLAGKQDQKQHTPVTRKQGCKTWVRA